MYFYFQLEFDMIHLCLNCSEYYGQPETSKEGQIKRQVEEEKEKEE